MAASVKPRTASGLPEYTPAQQIEFNRLLDIIQRAYELYGFTPLDTTTLELTDVLLAKEAGETGKEVYQFEKGKNNFTLRFDLTVPLARFVAQYEGQLAFPFSRYAIGKVYRAERAQAGRFREFYQCDIDTIGSDDPVVDAQFSAVINRIFSEFNFGEFTIRLNNRKVLNGFFEGIGLPAASADVLRIIDKMEKISREDLIGELKALGLTDEQVTRVLDFTAITGDNDSVLAQLRTLDIQNEVFQDGLTKLDVLVQSLRMMGVPEKRFQIDLRIARGLDYYTGTVYETVLNEYPEVGSVCSGGRYDNLAGLYTNTRLPGVGISIGLTRLFYALSKIGVIKSEAQSLAKVIVMPFTDEQVAPALDAAAMLRNAGVNTAFYNEPNKLDKKMRYADKMGFDYVVLVGQREADNGEVSIKDMQAGETTTIQATRLVEFIAK